MKTTFISATILATLAAPLFADAHAAKATGMGLSADGSQLTMFPGLTEVGATLDLTGGTLDAIAYRPVTGDVIGFSKKGGVYGIDLETGALISMDATMGDDVMMGADAAVGLDFNNAIDAVRAVSTDGVNLVYFPKDFGDDKANSVRRFTDLAYAEGDTNVGATPQIFANAYTNAVDGAKASSTAQYALDAGTDSLVTLANNAGTLATVAPITVDGEGADITSMGGFDIVSSAEGENMAYALLTIGDSTGIYGIDLETGAATMMADAGADGFSGFAVMLTK